MSERPEDDLSRMTFARRVAHWELGDAGWADTILDAYWDHLGDTGEEDE